MQPSAEYVWAGRVSPKPGRQAVRFAAPVNPTIEQVTGRTCFVFDAEDLEAMRDSSQNVMTLQGVKAAELLQFSQSKLTTLRQALSQLRLDFVRLKDRSAAAASEPSA